MDTISANTQCITVKESKLKKVDLHVLREAENLLQIEIGGNHLQELDLTPLEKKPHLQDLVLGPNPYRKPVDLSPLMECEGLRYVTFIRGGNPRWTREYTVKKWREEMHNPPLMTLPEPRKVRRDLKIWITNKQAVDYETTEWRAKERGGETGFTTYTPKVGITR